jgi:hypothetical protein
MEAGRATRLSVRHVCIKQPGRNNAWVVQRSARRHSAVEANQAMEDKASSPVFFT